MMRLPTLSVVTISYNQARYLGECLASVSAQRTSGVEHIVVDPGSTDGSLDIIERCAQSIDLRILEKDDGPADGLNKGFSAATGDIFCYVNADDRLVPDAIAHARHFFESHPEVDVLCGAIRIIDERGRPALRSRTADRFNLARYAAGICTVGQQATFFRRSAFEKAGGFNRDNRITWDGELLVDMALSGARFATVNRILGEFRIYGGSITGSGLHLERARTEHGRIREKIRRSGVRLKSHAGECLSRLAYKADLLRHLRYVMVR